jgi:hypothetical protein
MLLAVLAVVALGLFGESPGETQKPREPLLTLAGVPLLPSSIPCPSGSGCIHCSFLHGPGAIPYRARDISCPGAAYGR